MCKCNETVAKNMAKFKESYLSELDTSNLVALEYNLNTFATYTGPISKKRYVVDNKNRVIYVEREDAEEFLKYRKIGKPVFNTVEFVEVVDEVVEEIFSAKEEVEVIPEVIAESVEKETPVLAVDPLEEVKQEEVVKPVVHSNKKNKKEE